MEGWTPDDKNAFLKGLFEREGLGESVSVDSASLGRPGGPVRVNDANGNFRANLDKLLPVEDRRDITVITGADGNASLVLTDTPLKRIAAAGRQALNAIFRKLRSGNAPANAVRENRQVSIPEPLLDRIILANRLSPTIDLRERIAYGVAAEAVAAHFRVPDVANSVDGRYIGPQRSVLQEDLNVDSGSPEPADFIVHQKNGQVVSVFATHRHFIPVKEGVVEIGEGEELLLNEEDALQLMQTYSQHSAASGSR